MLEHDPLAVVHGADDDVIADAAMTQLAFQPLAVGPITLPGRIIKTATYEGMGAQPPAVCVGTHACLRCDGTKVCGADPRCD